MQGRNRIVSASAWGNSPSCWLPLSATDAAGSSNCRSGRLGKTCAAARAFPIVSTSASPTACLLRMYGHAGTQNDRLVCVQARPCRPVGGAAVKTVGPGDRRTDAQTRRRMSARTHGRADAHTSRGPFGLRLEFCTLGPQTNGKGREPPIP